MPTLLPSRFVRLIIVLCLLCGLLPFSGCNSKPSKEARMAAKLCECYEPMLSMMDQAEQIGGKDSLEALQFTDEFAERRKKMVDCANELRDEFGETEDPKEAQRILDELKEQCPDVFEFIHE